MMSVIHSGLLILMDLSGIRTCSSIFDFYSFNLHNENDTYKMTSQMIEAIRIFKMISKHDEYYYGDDDIDD